MEDVPVIPQDDVSPAGSHQEAPRRKPRARATTACDTCRNRRTRCDNRRPACGYCRARGVECHYEQTIPAPTSKVELELAAINQRLDYITRFLPPSQWPATNSDHCHESSSFTGEEKLPFQLLGTDCMMSVLGLGPGFAQELARLERSVLPKAIGHTTRMCIIQQQQAIAALAAFSTYVHMWYPVLQSGFSERYLDVISGPINPGPESCMVLLVAAIGTLAQQDHALGASGCYNASSELYIEAAMVSLSTVLVDNSIESIQCLILLSIYYCCLSRPWQSYDYAMIASFKVQNILKYTGTSDGELYEVIKRAYWTVLLLESELRAQFDMVGSGIWNYDDQIALPDHRSFWQFDIIAGSPGSTTASQEPTNNIYTDTVLSYFLAEIAMRRMLHRCNTAIRKTPQGEIVYAPNIALELELQLDEWYGYLPETVLFGDFEIGTVTSLHSTSPIEPLSNFLRVQYYCCKLSIYWPAVYQSIQNGTATEEILKHCERFFCAYIRLMPSILICIRDCIVNRWTLYATIFMTSMAVMQAVQTPCIKNGSMVDWPHLLTRLRSADTVDRRIVEASPSLSLLHGALSERLAEINSSFEDSGNGN